MSLDREEGPVYYREIQKNAYLKRIPNEFGGSKLIPLGHKKPPLKPMWTQLCVHNGRTPYLEQYPEADHPCALSHRPVWRACLSAARHVTGSVRPRQGQEYDFLVDTDHGPVRMLAPNWETMQDWVGTLRDKLAELKIMGKGENVYCSPPAPPPPRAAARDPNSPLPPTPPVPPDRVPGIELTPTTTIRPQIEPQVDPPHSEPPPPETDEPTIDISDWEPFRSLPSTSQVRERTHVAKICGQNICLNNSIFKRDATDSDEEFFAEIDRAHSSMENINFDGEYKQTVVVSNGEVKDPSAENGSSDRPANITVIQVSNKDAPHTAIPILGPETEIFDFEFNKTTNEPTRNPNFVNIVNTEINVQNSNDYGTIFSKNDDYNNSCLTTTVKLTGVTNDNLYERLCMASTSTEPNPSPLPKRLKFFDKVRKSSLPNLEVTDSTYEYLFLSQNDNSNVTLNNTSSVSATPSNNTTQISTSLSNNTNQTSTTPSNNTNQISTTQVNNTIPISATVCNNTTQISTTQVNNTSSVSLTQPEINQNENNVSVNAVSESRVLRSSVERSQSQNAYDNTPRRDSVRRVQNNSPKRDGKSDKTEPTQAKPIWKRGLTELSLLTRLRGIGQGKRQESPPRQDIEAIDRNALTSPVKVVHRSRPEVRIDSSRRRSSSLSNGQSPPALAPPAPRPAPSLQPLRARQAAALRAEQRRGAALVAAVPTREPPVFADYNKQVWVCWWGGGGGRWGARAGDRVVALRGRAPRDAPHARQLLAAAHTHHVDGLFHRVPLGKIYVLNKRDQESIGIKLDNECNIISVENDSPASRGALPPPGKWAVTEVNNRPLNLVKGGEEEMNRLSLHGTEVSVLIQPSALVKKLRAALKGNKTLLGLR